VPDVTHRASIAPAAPDGHRSTRDAASENFPVGSWLIAREKRPIVAAFYRFARRADDIADDPMRDPARKLALLDAADAALTGRATDVSDGVVAAAEELRGWFLAHELSLAHPRQLLDAFRADAANRPCRSWSDLLAYCRYSANPVGRFLLELHGEDDACHAPADALCTGLQILNHVQDCGDDWRRLSRCYIPTDWLGEAGCGTQALAARQASKPVLRALDRVMDGIDRLNERARALPDLLRSRRLRMEAGAIVWLARRLATRLRGGDPLARRIALGRFDHVRAMAIGLARGFA
jgi:squalene synthase HpnC